MVFCRKLCEDRSEVDASRRPKRFRTNSNLRNPISRKATHIKSEEFSFLMKYKAIVSFESDGWPKTNRLFGAYLPNFWTYLYILTNGFAFMVKPTQKI